MQTASCQTATAGAHVAQRLVALLGRQLLLDATLKDCRATELPSLAYFRTMERRAVPRLSAQCSGHSEQRRRRGSGQRGSETSPPS